MEKTKNREPNIVPKKRNIVHKVKTFEGESAFVVPSSNTLVDEQNDTIIAQSGGVGGVDVLGVNEEFANLVNVPTCSGPTPSGPVTPLPPSGPTSPTCSGPITSGGGGTSGGTTTPPTGPTGGPTPPPVCGPSTGGGGVTPIGTTTPPTTPSTTSGGSTSNPTPTFIFVPSGSGILSGGGEQTGSVWIPPICTPAPVATPAPIMGGGFGGGGGMLPQQESMGAEPSFLQKNKMLIGGLLILAILGYVITQHKKQA